MSISALRRQVKNVAYNFSDAQVKVREATSNDPWGPTTALMAEIADLTHNPMSFTEIMSMVWKRLNDHGKNWRHGNTSNINHLNMCFSLQESCIVGLSNQMWK